MGSGCGRVWKFLSGLSGHTYKIEMERAQMIFGSNFSMHLFDGLELEPKKEAEGPPNFCLAEKQVEMNRLMLWWMYFVENNEIPLNDMKWLITPSCAFGTKELVLLKNRQNPLLFAFQSCHGVFSSKRAFFFHYNHALIVCGGLLYPNHAWGRKWITWII